MPDDETPAERRYPLSTSKMSKTPSWIMLGFLLGAAFVLALPPLRRKSPPEIATFKAAEPPPPAAPREPPLLTTIEDVFAAWGQLAVWSDHVTEVALWNVRDKEFNQFFEVWRESGNYYFRTIPQLTRHIIKHGKPQPDECPLQFTESDEQYAEWQKYGRAERPLERAVQTRPRPSSPPASLPTIDRGPSTAVPLVPFPASERPLPPLELPATDSSARKKE